MILYTISRHCGKWVICSYFAQEGPGEVMGMANSFAFLARRVLYFSSLFAVSQKYNGKKVCRSQTTYHIAILQVLLQCYPQMHAQCTHLTRLGAMLQNQSGNISINKYYMIQTQSSYFDQIFSSLSFKSSLQTTASSLEPTSLSKLKPLRKECRCLSEHAQKGEECEGQRVLKWLLEKGVVQGNPQDDMALHRAQQKRNIIQKSGWKGCPTVTNSSSLLTRRLQARREGEN